MKEELTQERLKEVLHYCPETGIFTWIKKLSKRIKIGVPAGCDDHRGYLLIRIDGILHKSHRLAWLYVYGCFPVNDIDHIDNIRNHNWIKNLREATRSNNMQNQIKATANNKSTKLLGSSFFKRDGNYRAQIQINKKNKHIGYFDTPEKAHQAYIEEKRKIHPFGMI